MQIRPITETETETVSTLIRDTLTSVNGRDYPQAVIQNLCELYTPDNIAGQAQSSDLLVAVDDGQIIGVGALKGDFITGVFVKADHLGRGVGKKLMESLENLARKRGLQEVVLNASITAHSFYQKLDYVAIEERASKTAGKVFRMNKVLKRKT